LELDTRTILKETDKWADGIKIAKPVDMWKIRSRVQKFFLNILMIQNNSLNHHHFQKLLSKS
jgi:hypothetical protein